MSMLIRPAVPADARTLAALAIHVWLDTYAFHGIRDGLAEYVLTTFTPDHFSRVLTAPDKRLLVAENNALLTGYLLLTFDSPCPTNADMQCEIDTLYVQPAFHGKGVGSALLAAADAAARNRQHSALWLAMYVHNQKASAFYTARGFERIGTTYFPLEGEQHENAILARGINLATPAQP